jgi:hypothetical protein
LAGWFVGKNKYSEEDNAEQQLYPLCHPLPFSILLPPIVLVLLVISTSPHLQRSFILLPSLVSFPNLKCRYNKNPITAMDIPPTLHGHDCQSKQEGGDDDREDLMDAIEGPRIAITHCSHYLAG